MKKKVIAGFAAILLCVLFSFTGVFAAEQSRVYDYAGLFTTEETQELEESIGEYREKTNLDLVVVTIDDAEGKTSREYADDFYDYNGFGVGSDHSGILLLIDMDNRMAYLSTTGRAIEILTDSRIQEITDEVASCVGDGEYARGAQVFLEKTDAFVNPNITGMLLIALALAMLVGAGSVVGVWYKYTHGHKADQYELDKNSSLDLSQRDDIFMGRFVTSRKIPRNTGGGGSSTHSSSSGSTHGGGGSRF